MARKKTDKKTDPILEAMSALENAPDPDIKQPGQNAVEEAQKEVKKVARQKKKAKSQEKSVTVSITFTSHELTMVRNIQRKLEDLGRTGSRAEALRVALYTHDTKQDIESVVEEIQAQDKRGKIRR